MKNSEIYLTLLNHGEMGYLNYWIGCIIQVYIFLKLLEQFLGGLVI